MERARSIFSRNFESGAQMLHRAATSGRPLVAPVGSRETPGEAHREVWKGFSLGRSLLQKVKTPDGIHYILAPDAEDPNDFPKDAVYATLAVGLVALVFSMVALVILASRGFHSSCSCPSAPSPAPAPTPAPAYGAEDEERGFPETCSREERGRYGSEFYPSLKSHVYVDSKTSEPNDPVYPAGIFYGDIVVMGQVHEIPSQPPAPSNATSGSSASWVDYIPHKRPEREEWWDVMRDTYNLTTGEGRCGVGYLTPNFKTYTSATSCQVSDFERERPYCCVNPKTCRGELHNKTCEWRSVSVRSRVPEPFNDQIFRKRQASIYETYSIAEARRRMDRASYYAAEADTIFPFEEPMTLVKYESGERLGLPVRDSRDPMRAVSVFTQSRNAAVIPLKFDLRDDALGLTEIHAKARKVRMVYESQEEDGKFVATVEEINATAALLKRSAVPRDWPVVVISRGIIPNTYLVEIQDEKYVIVPAAASDIASAASARASRDPSSCEATCNDVAACFGDASKKLVCMTDLLSRNLKACCNTCHKKRIYNACLHNGQ